MKVLELSVWPESRRSRSLSTSDQCFSDIPTCLSLLWLGVLPWSDHMVNKISWLYLFVKDLLIADTFIPFLSQGPHLHPFQQCSWPVHKGLPSSIRRSGQRARKTSQVRVCRNALQGVCSTSSEHWHPHKIYSNIFIYIFFPVTVPNLENSLLTTSLKGHVCPPEINPPPLVNSVLSGVHFSLLAVAWDINKPKSTHSCINSMESQSKPMIAQSINQMYF
jgi:hypothetical protein